MNTDLITDEAACALHVKLLKRKEELMSPKMQKYRDQLMRTQIAKDYHNTRSKGGLFEFKGMVDVWEEKQMRADCLASDGTTQINADYWKWKESDLHARGLDGAWLTR
jgi:hypothetical protein